MSSELKNMVTATDIKAGYDASAKRLLGNKSILAHILIKTVKEFKGMRPGEVADLIEGTPYIGKIPIEPGLTNAVSESTGDRVIGFNTENTEINEGQVRFDIVFYVRMRDGLSQVIINVEAQQKEPGSYDILNRSVFYVSRLISSQKERDFKNSKYNDIKRVYSIWVCMNMKENILSHVHLTKDDIIGEYEWKGKLDLFNIVLIGLSKKLPENNAIYELHRLLGALLSQELTVDERLTIIGKEYDITVEDKFREEVSNMCNLSQGIEERSFERGIEQGVKQGIEQGIEQGVRQGIEQGEVMGEAKIIIKMYNKGFTVEEIAETTDKKIEEVTAIIEGIEPVIV